MSHIEGFTDGIVEGSHQHGAVDLRLHNDHQTALIIGHTDDTVFDVFVKILFRHFFLELQERVSSRAFLIFFSFRDRDPADLIDLAGITLVFCGITFSFFHFFHGSHLSFTKIFYISYIIAYLGM